MLTTIYWCFGFLCLTGLVLHFLLQNVNWKKVTWKGADWVVKGFPDLMGLGVLIVTSLSKFAVEKEWVAWAIACLLAGLALVIWKILQYRIESLLKNAEREIANAAQLESISKVERARAEVRFLSELRLAFHTFLRKKVDRVFEVVSAMAPEKNVRIDTARKALTPKPQLRQILETLGIMLKTRVGEKCGRLPNIRLGIYVAGDDGAMTPMHALSMNQRHSKPFDSYREHREGFRVGTTQRPSQIVRCVQEKTPIMIVSDCEQEAEQGSFFFYSDPQKQYLKSLCVHYLEEVCTPSGKMVEGVLSIDADQPNAFEESEREDLLLCLQEFGLRIKYEMLLISLLGEKT